MNDNKIMNKAADNIRILAASMVEKAKSGHPGGAMGGADFINTLYSEFLVYDPENPISLTPCIQNSWFTTPRILLGRDVTVSFWILATWLQCSIASSVSSANTRWRI